MMHDEYPYSLWMKTVNAGLQIGAWKICSGCDRGLHNQHVKGVGCCCDVKGCED